MSNAAFPEVGLAADLYIKAVENGLPHLLKHGGEYAPKEDMAALSNAFRNTARHLIELKVIGKEKNKDWHVDHEVVSNLTEDQAKSVLPHYDTIVRAHEPVMSQIENSNLQDYANYFKSMHKPVEFEIDEDVNTVFTEESKQDIIGSALNLVDAIHEDPAKGAFLTGVAGSDIDALRQTLSDAKYLMPEMKGSARTAPLGEQALRGTPEQQDAIIEAAIVINANIEMPEKIVHGDRPMMHAAMLSQAIERAEQTEAQATSNYDPVAPNPFNSDLMQEDARVILDAKEAGDRVSETAQIDPENGENVLVSKAALAALDDHFEALADHNIFDPDGTSRKDVLSRKDFVAPGMGPESAKAISATIKALKEVRTYKPAEANEIVSSDEGGKATEAGFEDEFGGDADEATTSGSSDVSPSARGAIKDRSESDKSVLDQMDEDAKWAEREQLSAKLSAHVEDLLPAEDEKISIPMDVFNEWESTSMSLTYKGIDETLMRIADRDIGDMSKGIDRGTFATFQEAMKGGSKSHVTLVTDDFAMSARRYREKVELDPSQGNSGRVVKVEPGEGIFEKTQYRSPHPTNAQSFVNQYVRDNKVTEDGKPNIAFRSFLRQMSRRSVVAGSQEEAVAWKIAAQNEVALDQEEQDLRQEVLEDKTGKSFIDLQGKDVRGFVDILEASGTKELARLKIDAEGNGLITHPEGPDLKISMQEVPEGFGSAKAGREFGGMIDHKRMQSALEASTEDKGITLVMVGETPKGFISKIDESHTKQREERPVDRHPDMALS